MEYNERAFFTSEEDSIEGVVVIETSETGPGYDEPSYRVAEKWTPDDAEDRWLDYWMPASFLTESVESGKMAYAKQVTDTQYEGILNLTGA